MSAFTEDKSAPNMPRVLDPCSGSRMMWFDRGHPDAIFGDRRQETLTVTDRSHGKRDGTRTLTVCPDMLMDFRALPFQDESFRLVAFDPPHLVRAGPRSWLAPSTASWEKTGATTCAPASANASAYCILRACWCSSGTRRK